MNVDELLRRASGELDEAVRGIHPRQTLPAVRRRTRRQGLVTAAVVAVLMVAAASLVVVSRERVEVGPASPGEAVPTSSLRLQRVRDPGLVEAGWQQLDAVATLGGRTVAVGEEGAGDGRRTAAVWVSDDGGQSWTRIDDVVGGADLVTMTDVAAVDGRYVAVGSSGGWGSVWTSPDGLGWDEHVGLALSRLPGETGSSLAAVVEGPTGGVAVGSAAAPTGAAAGEGSVAAAWIGDDPRGLWRRADLPVDPGSVRSELIGLARTAGALYALGHVDGRPAVWRSPTGAVWQRLDVRGLPPAAVLAGIGAAGGQLTVFGADAAPDGDAALWTSADGARWTPVADAAGVFGGRGPQAIAALQDSAAGPVAVGTDGDRAAAWHLPAGQQRWTRVGGDLDDDGRVAATGLASAAPGLVVVGHHAADGPTADPRDAAVWIIPIGEAAPTAAPGTPSPGASTPADPPADDPPAEVVAHVWRDDAPGIGVYRLSTADGTVLDTLLDDTQVGEGATSQDIAPDGRTLYVARTVTACLAEVVAVDLADGTTSVLGAGTDPVVSPDGSLLAYARSGGSCGDEAQVVVRDLRTGAERVWRTGGLSPTTPVEPRSLSWAADGATLAFHLVSGDAVEVRLLAVSGSGGQLGDARRLAPADPRATWQLPVFEGLSGRFSVVETCCGSDPGTPRIVRVDLASGSAVGAATTLPGLPSAIDTDTSGDHLLLTMPGADGGAPLLMSSRGGPPVAIPVPGRVFGARW